MTTNSAAVETRQQLVARLGSALGPEAVGEGDAAGDVRITVPLERLVDSCVLLNSRFEARLATMVGLDDRARTGKFRLVYVFSLGRFWVSVEAEVGPSLPSFPSVTPHLPAAHWYEREVRDLLGLVPEGHPDPRRLVLHDDWPEDVYPLRKDFDPAVPVARVDGPRHRFHHLHGEGIVEIPVGPIHAGVIEPGHFRFAAVGEVVLHLETRLFYSHRGMEKLAEGKRAGQVLQIAERICGACSASHAVAYCQAIESLAGADLPARAAALRTLVLELERLYNHVGDLGNICAGVGFAVGASQGGRLKEELQRLNGRLTGHRFLRGMCRVGGVRRVLDGEAIRDAVEVGDLPPYRSAVGVTESPRGENVHWVRTGPEGRIDRYRIRSASFCNWPIVALAVPGNMVPDFPLINKSFELCYSCLDR